VTSLRHRLRTFTWLALFAMLGLALAPSVSRALDADPASNPWAQICTTPGSVDAPALPGTLAHAEHCPLCGHGAGPLGLPPAAVAVLALPAQRAFVAPPARAAVAHASVRATAQPRAPPSFS
jgi:Protein of unknown function (DUF2946)